MEIIESILTENPCYRAKKKIKIKGLMLHSVGCSQPNAETFIKKWNNPDSGRACVHAFIDGNTGKVYQTLPWEHKAWHCGGTANGTHIGVEMCEPACLHYTGGASFTCSDKEAAMAVVKRTYDAAVELFAFLCKKYALEPLADGVIISHKEGHDRGLASGHGDPEHLWRGIQCSYSMDTFRQAVAEEMKRVQVPSEQTMPVQEQAAALQSAAEGKGNSKAVSVGDVVSLMTDAVYYDGKKMPDWVKSEQWIVKSINGDRAVIDKNVSGTRAICSPVKVSYLIAEGQTIPAEQTAPTALAESKRLTISEGEKSTESMTVSEKCVELVAKYEGCSLEAYRCPAGVWTIGYGHTAGVEPGDTLPSEEAAKNLLRQDLKKYAASVNHCVEKGLIAFPLNQNQFDALTSFCYNCGAGNLQKLVKERSAEEVAEKLTSYNKGGGRVLAGLTRRREEEKALFLSDNS